MKGGEPECCDDQRSRGRPRRRGGRAAAASRDAELPVRLHQRHATSWASTSRSPSTPPPSTRRPNALAMQYLASVQYTVTRTRRRVCCSGAPAVLQLLTPEHTRAMNPRLHTARVVPPRALEPRWRRALGLQLLGPVQGSGLRDAAFLVRRSDDQMVQLSELLHLVVVHADPPRARRGGRRRRQRGVRPDPHRRGPRAPGHDAARSRSDWCCRDEAEEPAAARPRPTAPRPDRQGRRSSRPGGRGAWPAC